MMRDYNKELKSIEDEDEKEKKDSTK